MLLDQKLKYNPDGTVILRSTYDVGLAADIAKEVSDAGGGRGGNKNHEVRVMGYIPPELFTYNPWLIEAKRAQKGGDLGEYTRLMRKFFELFPQYAVLTPKKYF